MKRLLLALLVSGPAYAEAVRICYSDANFCAIREGRATMYLPQNVFASLSENDKAEYKQMWGGLKELTAAEDQRFANAPTVTRSLNADVDEMSKPFDAETRALVGEIAECAGGIVACSSASLTIASGQVYLFWLAKAGCAWTGWQCADAKLAYEEWKAIRAEKQRERGASGGDAGSSGDGRASANEGRGPIHSSAGGSGRLRETFVEMTDMN